MLLHKNTSTYTDILVQEDRHREYSVSFSLYQQQSCCVSALQASGTGTRAQWVATRRTARRARVARTLCSRSTSTASRGRAARTAASLCTSRAASSSLTSQVRNLFNFPYVPIGPEFALNALEICFQDIREMPFEHYVHSKFVLIEEAEASRDLGIFNLC